MVYGITQRELYSLRYGLKGAVCSTVQSKESCMIYGMTEKKLYDLRYDRKRAG